MSDSILQEGTQIDGKYEVLCHLGSGTFGHVYQARQKTTGQTVALKEMRFSEGATDEEIQLQVDRFEREMKLCAELSHPNLVGLIDSGELESGKPYAVFEFVPGETLAELLVKEVRLEPREALRLMGQVLDALAAAHRHKIVHRDLKPANIMIGGTGALRNATLLDLGLGGFVDSRRDEMRRLTGSSEFAGTLQYAAPEQLFGASPSPRSDLYAWGLVLFECLTGEHPFAGNRSALSLLEHRAIRLPDSLASHPIGRLLARVTEPDPVDRDVDAESLAHELHALDARGLEERLLAAPREEGHESRRQLAVVSCRLEVEAGDFEQTDQVLRSLHQICAEAARDYGGHVASKLGERVVLYFGHPVAHENDVRRAARTALEIVREVERSQSRAGSETVRAHIGVHAGPVVVRSGSPTDALAQVEIVGPTSVVVTQLDGIAAPGEIMLSETAHRLLGASMECEPAGEHVLRGSNEKLEVHRLLEGAAPSLSSKVLDSGFVGRERALRHLLESWKGSESGRAESIVLRGEPGIGKSRLVRELGGRLAGVRWIECRCLEEWRDTPLRPVTDLLREIDPDPVRLVENSGGDVATAVPLLRDVLGLPPDPAYPRQMLSPDREKSVLLYSLASIALASARDEPVVLVFEDLHWSDPTTRDLIDLVVQRIEADEGVRILLLMTTRDWMPMGASVIQLSALTDEEAAQLASYQFTGERPPSSELLRQVVERSDGIPLFVEEVVRVLRDAELFTESSAAEDLIPDSLEALLQSRLDTLSESTRELTQIAAAVGREFDLPLLQNVAPRSESAMRREIDEAVRKGIIVPLTSSQRERFVFRHALIRDAAWMSMLTAARWRYHGRIVEELERERPALADEEPELLAHHLGHAGRYAAAAEMWHRAGRRALANATYTEGISLLEKGLRVLSLLEDSAGRKRIEAQLLETLGMAYYSTLGYAHPKVAETFTHVETICDELGESVPLQTLYGLWGVRFMLGAVAETAALVDRFAVLAERSEEPLAALYAHGTAGLRAAVLGDFATADDRLERSTRECEAFADTVHLERLPYGGAVHPPGWWSWVRIMRGHPDGARDALARMDAVAKSLDKAYGHALAGHFTALVAVELQDVEAALELSQRQIDFSNEQHILLWALCSQCLHGWAVARSGDPASGTAEISSALGILSGIGMRCTSSTFLALRAEAELLAGNRDAAIATVDEGMNLASIILDRFYQSPLERIRAAALLAGGDRTAAEGALRRSLDLARAQGAGWFALQAATDLARLLGETDRREEGLSLITGTLEGFDEGADTAPVAQARDLAHALA